MAIPRSLVTTNHGVGQSRASAGSAGLSITACCTSTLWLWEGKAWCPFVTCLLAHRAENPSSHQAVDWCFSQLPTIRWRQMPETPVSGILRTPTTWRFNSWLPPRVCWEPDVYRPAILVLNTNPNLQQRKLSLHLGPSCLPQGAQSSAGASLFLC